MPDGSGQKRIGSSIKCVKKTRGIHQLVAAAISVRGTMSLSKKYSIPGKEHPNQLEKLANQRLHLTGGRRE